MLQRALDIYRSKFMPSLQPRKNSQRVAPIPPPEATPLTADALSAQNALYGTAVSPTLSNMSGTTESLDFADCFSLTDDDSKDETATVAANAAAAAAFCDLLLQEASLLQDTSSYGSDSTATTPDPLTADFFDQFIMTNNDPFLTSDISKLYNTQLLDPLF
jgi:hypothetical protein